MVVCTAQPYWGATDAFRRSSEPNTRTIVCSFGHDIMTRSFTYNPGAKHEGMDDAVPWRDLSRNGAPM